VAYAVVSARVAVMNEIQFQLFCIGQEIAPGMGLNLEIGGEFPVRERFEKVFVCEEIDSLKPFDCIVTKMG
jgi:hypothetical protein